MSSARTDSRLPLYVDLDGTLIKSDVTFEALLLLLRRNVFYLALVPLWLLRGLAHLKQRLAALVDVPVESIPFNEEFLDYLRREKARGRKLILISASHQSQVERVAALVGLFDRVEGTQADINLKSHNKLARIRQLNGEGGFAYAGNARADLPLWGAADQAILVNCGDGLRRAINDNGQRVLQFDRPGSRFACLLTAMRPHQWFKNLLLFLPLILSHQLNDLTLFLQASLGFVSFSLCASSVYLLNDLLDLASDRLHPSKRQRPLAAGELPLGIALAAIPALLLAAFAVALLLPGDFLWILLGYWLLTTLYSLMLKQRFLVDVLVLALLYTARIFAGAAAIDVVATSWLIAFSMSLFLGLAIVKRVTELTRLRQVAYTSAAGRGYHTDHRRLMIAIGAAASLGAVIIFAFYINAPATTELYSSPAILWLVCPLLLLLLVRIWVRARSGELHEDPVVFALGDHSSQFIVLLCGALIWLAI
ncbi:MAG: UbiA family prenyltransferase [Pseudohongiellaceae bacterium]